MNQEEKEFLETEESEKRSDIFIELVDNEMYLSYLLENFGKIEYRNMIDNNIDITTNDTILSKMLEGDSKDENRYENNKQLLIRDIYTFLNKYIDQFIKDEYNELVNYMAHHC